MNPKNSKQLSFAICFTALSLSSSAFLDAQGFSPNDRLLPSTGAEDSKTEFLRLKNDSSGEPLAMQTAITRYRPQQGDLVVDLIGAVHLGEKDYYEALNRQFDVYDVVLYELVAPQGTRIPAGGQRSRENQSPLSLVSWLQDQAKSKLGLESQLEMVDYQKSNFTHADLSPAEMSSKMAERGDNALTVGLSAMAEILRQQNRAVNSPESNEVANQLANESLFELINNPLKLKRMMASQFAASGVMDTGLGQTLNQMLITDRNAAALKVMQKEIASGKKKIAIFYGAAHMPEFEKQLSEDFGLEKTNQVWVDAWDLTKSNAETGSSGATDLLMNLLNELSK